MRHVFENVTAGPGNTFLLLLAVLLPAIVAFAILYRQALSLPYQDDYGTILDFAANYDQLPSIADEATVHRDRTGQRVQARF